MKLEQLICKNCIFALTSRGHMPFSVRCFISPPPRHTAQVDPTDLCSKGKWLVRRKWDEFKYDAPIPMGYEKLLSYCMNDEMDVDYFVIVAIPQFLEAKKETRND